MSSPTPPTTAPPTARDHKPRAERKRKPEPYPSGRYEPGSRVGKGGRKPRVQGALADQHVVTKVTPAERAAIERAAEGAGKTVAAFVRDAVAIGVKRAGERWPEG